MSIHYGCHHSEIFQEIQKNDILRDDEVPTEYAHTLMERRGSCYHHLRSLCLSETIRQMIMYRILLSLIILGINPVINQQLNSKKQLYSPDPGTLVVSSVRLFRFDTKNSLLTDV
jgi:hypothetical protein